MPQTGTKPQRRLGRLGLLLTALPLIAAPTVIASGDRPSDTAPERHAASTHDSPAVRVRLVGDAPIAPSEIDLSQINETELSDIGWLAEDEGVSLREAVARVGWHHAFSEMVDDVRRGFPDEYASAAAGGPGEGGPWVAFKGTAPPAAEEKIVAFTERIAYAPPVAIVDGRGFTESQLADRVKRAHYAVWQTDGLVQTAVTSYDNETGVITIEAVPGAGRSAQDAKREIAAAARQAAPDATIDVNLSESMPGSLHHGNHWIRGGWRITGCTSGFVVVTNSTNRRGVATAEHCDAAPMFYDHGEADIILEYKASGDNELGDFEWYRKPGWKHVAQFQAEPGELRPVHDTGSPVEDQFLCKFGKTSGFSCDYVYELDICDDGFCGLVGMDDHDGRGGDSGGPWFSAAFTAYGLHHGEKWFDLHTRDVWSRQDYMIFGLGVHVLTVD